VPTPLGVGEWLGYHRLVICPSCRAEYRPGFTHCADCGVELVDSLPPEAHSFERRSIGGELVEVYRAWGGPQAELVRSLLEANGIECALEGEGKNRVYNLTVGPMAEVRIMVEVEDVEAAENILQAADRGEFTLEE
jgi:hypothetical protein